MEPNTMHMSSTSARPFSLSLSLILNATFTTQSRRDSLSLSLSLCRSAPLRRSSRPRPRSTLTNIAAAICCSGRNKPNSTLLQSSSHFSRTAFLSSSLSALASLSLLFPSPSLSAPLYTPPTLATTTMTNTTEIHSASKVADVPKTLSEAWNVVHDTFFDRTYNNQDWDAALQKALEEISDINSKDEAYMKIKSMLGTLGDPYTRIVNSKEYESFEINKDGAVEGVGLQLMFNQNSCGCLLVLSPIEGGPAARAGIVHGDEVVQINGEAISNMMGEEVFNSLRGHAGTPVTLKVRHQQSGGDSDTELAEVTLVREKVFLSPVSAAIIPHAVQDGHTSKTGYIHISSFSQNAAHDLESTILQMEQNGVDSYILDLRDNPGGLVQAGLDAAQLWLNGYKTVINIIDHEGKILPLTVGNNRALTDDPLVVLVDKGTASASEILAAALHDNGRATLIGEKTFGKGKIQSVTELQDGSGLFVTIAKYLSPGLHPIDEVGIIPDALCSPNYPELSSKVEGAISLKNMNQENVEALAHDSCVLLAERQLAM